MVDKSHKTVKQVFHENNIRVAYSEGVGLERIGGGEFFKHFVIYRAKRSAMWSYNSI